MSKPYRKKQLEEDTDAISQPSQEYNREDHERSEVAAVLRKIDYKHGREAVDEAFFYLETSFATWTSWSAPAKLALWLYETGSLPGSHMKDILTESRTQITRMDKPGEDWNNEDWKSFLEHMLGYIEKRKKSVLVKPPRIQDFRPMGAQQYQIWAAAFEAYVRRNQYTYQQVLTDMTRSPINYPPEARATWQAAAGDLALAEKELYELCELLDTQEEAKSTMRSRPEERRGKPYRRLDTRDGRQKFTGSCNYCHKIGHKEVACRKKRSTLRVERGAS
ncbi:hypothetical protein NEIRO03_0073 [Nematocida sp. AWRm78]|nr:hypothetical protein NEIRO02_0112 [Nematocida sp. AWRm79]KAI5182389.1 hypothetical protein NEIRO03_0073 [Nematocida sp. AWRm78]